ncbi:MAG: TIGR02679 domain-containing protein [Defluviitaleaceae bacterium]|nr:TIGR02679 domain-containing protein [Defluviitaleaceae bacterium]
MRVSDVTGGIQEALRYFTEDKGFDRLLGSMSDIYARYGRPFGAVRLTRPTPEEETALSEFFKRDYYNQALIRIGLADFERQMQKVFSTDVKLGDLLEGHSGRPIVARPESRVGAHKSTEQFAAGLMEELVPKFENTPAEAWLVEMMTHMRRTYRPWVEMYQEEPKAVMEMVKSVAKAINNLPGKEGALVHISEFAKKHMDSTYGLCFYEIHGQLFMRALAHHFDVPIPYNAEDSINLCVQAGILLAGGISHVTVYGLCATTYEDTPDEACQIYNSRHHAHVLSLENLSNLSTASAYGGKVFILGNPHVFSGVYERLREMKCTLISPMRGGTPAFLHLLRLLRAGGATLYYAGNLDYKGLIAADKLYMEFGKSFVPWRYSREDYEFILGENETLLPDEKKGLALHNEDLASLLSHMRKTGKTASSMPLVPILVEDIQGMI